jgi:hypothetical protein
VKAQMKRNHDRSDTKIDLEFRIIQVVGNIYACLDCSLVIHGLGFCKGNPDHI